MRGLGESEIYLAKEVCLTELTQSLQCSDNPVCACVESETDLAGLSHCQS